MATARTVSDVITNELRRALAFERKVRRAASDRETRFRWGTARFNTRAPLVIDVNTLEVTRPGQDMTAAALAGVAERIQGDLEHRHIHFEDPVAARSIARGLASRGWSSRRFVVMVHRGPPSLETPRSVRELGKVEYGRAHEEFIRGEPYGSDEESVEQLLLVADMVAKKIPTRYFGAGPRGRTVATCALFTQGRSAQIEDVGTVTRYRGRGFGQAIVRAAIGAAHAQGSRFLFLVADADDWPRRMYSTLGFRSVGNYVAFTHGGRVEFRH